MAEVIRNAERAGQPTPDDLPPVMPFSTSLGMPAAPTQADLEQTHANIVLEQALDYWADTVSDRRHMYLNDPVKWAYDTGVSKELWSGQRRILEAIRDNPQVAVMTCHTIGKDWTAAVAVCWWLSVHEPGTAFVLTSAPTGAQVKGILWRYINRMHEAADLVGRLNMTEWVIGNELVAIGRKPSEYNPSAFQGYHARYILVIFDEACGMPQALWDAASTLTSAEGARYFAIGNPDDPESAFARVCMSGSGWHVIQIGAEDTPNWTGEEVSDDLRAQLISRRWAEQKAIEWGDDSPLYVSKIKGLFPQNAEDGIVPASWAARCRYLADERFDDTPVCAGLDVGETTDRTVFQVRRGGRVAEREIIQHHGDAMNCVGIVAQLINDLDVQRVVIDVIGIGWGVFSRLRELSSLHNPNGLETTHGAELVRFSAGEASTQPDRFINKRAELWWEVGRERSRLGTWDLSECDDDAVAELTAPKYRLDGSKSRIQVESKDDVRKRLGRSPDLADALLMSFWEGDLVMPGALPSTNMQWAGTRL